MTNTIYSLEEADRIVRGILGVVSCAVPEKFSYPKRFNKSEIMKRAHTIHKESGASMSAALRKAWVEANIERIEDHRFLLNMKDYHDALDYKQMNQWSLEIRKLREQLAD